MQYIFADITITPYSEAASDILTAMLSAIGYDSFEQTNRGIKAYIQQDSFSPSSLSSTLSAICLPHTEFTFTIHELPDQDWNAEWERNSFDPILEREYGIRLNPRMAFGSGSHATTYQMTSLLLSADFTHQRVLDMGTGTGVLAIAMALRGARQVVAIDIDPFSVENAKENFALNGINLGNANLNNANLNNTNLNNAPSVEILLGDSSAIQGQFDTIVANIHKNIIIADLPTYTKHLSPRGTLFLSGFFTADIPDIQKAAAANGLTVLRTVEKDDWVVMQLTPQADDNR